MMQVRRTEQGQAVVLVLIAVAALMGFAALAVDGGLAYAERRRSQNAADASAYAAAMAAVDGKDYVRAALDQAHLNGFANDGVNNEVIINHPPVSGPYAGNDDYYQVVISSTFSPVFSQFVYNGPLKVTVEAVTHAEQPDSPTEGNAIHALTPHGYGIEFQGSVKVRVEGGNIYSNAGGNKDGVSGTIAITDGNILVRGTWFGDTSKVDPKPYINQPAQIIRKLPVPDCNIPEGKISGKQISPGRYPNGISLSGGGSTSVWTMEPGMYCISNGLTVNGSVELRGKDVFLVMESGTIKLNGSGTVYLTRPDSFLDAAGNEWGGTLIYVMPGNKTDVNLSGGNKTLFAGTIYAPGSECKIGGNAEAMGIKSNIICNNVVFHGSTNISISYKEPQNLQLGPMIGLVE
jgi:hypothetical protein